MSNESMFQEETGYGWYGVFIPTFKGGPYFATFADNKRDARKQFRAVFGPVPKGSEVCRLGDR